MKTLVWTYAGPRGPGIAEHYARHLREFATREGLEGATVEVRGATVEFVVADSDSEAVAAALRPHRIDAS